jgi:hypothetical protein
MGDLGLGGGRRHAQHQVGIRIDAHHRCYLREQSAVTPGLEAHREPPRRDGPSDMDADGAVGFSSSGPRPPGTVTDARLVRAPGRAAGGRAGNPSRGLPGHRNDVVHTPLRHATTSGGACVDRLWTLEPEAVTRHLTHCGRHESRCLLVIIDGGITSPVRQCLSAGHRARRRSPLGRPYRHRRPSPRRPPATVVGHRLA